MTYKYAILLLPILSISKRARTAPLLRFFATGSCPCRSFIAAAKQTSPPPPPTGTKQNVVQNTAQSIKEALQHHSTTRKPSTISSSALFTLGVAALAGATLYATRSPRIPGGIQSIENFNLDRFLGKWYELARIDHSFEKGLQRTQAEYSRSPNGSIQVINRGFNAKRNEWKISHGKAKPTIAPDIAALKVSFFGPFYGGYNIVALGRCTAPSSWSCNVF